MDGEALHRLCVILTALRRTTAADTSPCRTGIVTRRTNATGALCHLWEALRMIGGHLHRPNTRQLVEGLTTGEGLPHLARWERASKCLQGIEHLREL